MNLCREKLIRCIPGSHCTTSYQYTYILSSRPRGSGSMVDFKVLDTFHVATGFRLRWQQSYVSCI